MMNVQDLETSVRLGQKGIVFFIWEDKEYGLIKWKQQNQFGDHTDLAFGNPDFVKLADAFNMAGFHCDDSTKLRGTLEEAFNADRPAIVVIPIDYDENMKLTERLGQVVATI